MTVVHMRRAGAAPLCYSLMGAKAPICRFNTKKQNSSLE